MSNIIQKINFNQPRLSICIATYNRGKFIAETLDSIICQMGSFVELVVVDGASTDNTPEILGQYLELYPNIRYFQEKNNSGIDHDYDKSVGYATGEFCWLMSDDDLLKPGAIDRVLSELSDARNLFIINAEVRNSDLSMVLVERQLNFNSNKYFGKNEIEDLFAECMNYLSFIGCVVIRRSSWLARNREKYYGSLFIHVGVIFQSPPIENVSVISDPLIVIRYGNAMWTSRGFEIWLFIWPELVWSFSSFSEMAKQRVCDSSPWRKAKNLFYYRAIGAYSLHEFEKFMSPKTKRFNKFLALFISIFPGVIANSLSFLYFIFCNRAAHIAHYDLYRSHYATWFTRLFGRLLRSPR